MPSKTLDKYQFLDGLIKINLNKVSYYSESIANSIQIGWSNYTDINIGANKKERNLDKIYKNIEKLKIVEKKKITSEDFKKIKDDNIKYINDNYKKYFLNIKYKKRLIYCIQDSLCLSEILNHIIESYNYDYKKVNKENNKNLVVLPKIKEEKKENKNISYVVDKNSYVYVNLKLENGAMVLDKKSFEFENEEYERALKEGKDSYSYITEKIKYSPYEKKRRIFIQSMFELEQNLYTLKNKKLDITYPVEKYYQYSKIIVDNLYRELVNFDKTQNSVLQNLMDLTVNTYGSDRLLKRYDSIEKDFEDKILHSEDFVLKEIINTSRNLKRKYYIDYKDIESIVPTILDVYKAINNRIIKGASVLLNEYSRDFNYSINKVVRYMSVDEIITLYEELKSVLLKNSLEYKSNIVKKLIELQSVVSYILSVRLNKCKEIVIKEYLKEENIT